MNWPLFVGLVILIQVLRPYPPLHVTSATDLVTISLVLAGSYLITVGV